jgi:hypothetical protein
MNAAQTMKALQKLAGAVTDKYDPYAHVLQCSSPSVNFTFGNTHGLPFGYSLVLYGIQKGGKSLLSNMFAGQLHADDPDAVVVKYNTEMRERIQLTPKMKQAFGIDDNRYMPFETNEPKEVFDAIQTDVNALCQDGAKIKLIIIDSINSIMGRRMGDAKSVEQNLIGDHAQTIQDGLKRIQTTIRRNGIAVILIAQARAEMDIAEQMKGNKIKMAASFGVKHFGEYFMLVEQNSTAAAQKDLDGKDLTNTGVAAGIGVSNGSKAAKGEQTGHKIRATMKDSSCGPKGRVAQFTLDYNRGLINIHEEVFLLAMARNVIVNEKGNTWVMGNRKWTGGKPSIIDAIKGDTSLQTDIIKELRKRDLAGMFTSEDQADLQAMLQREAVEGDLLIDRSGEK